MKPALPAHPAMQDARNGAQRYPGPTRLRSARLSVDACARCGGAFAPDLDGCARCLLCGRSRPPAPMVRCSAQCQSCAWLERHRLPRGEAVHCEHDETHCELAHISVVMRAEYWTLRGRRGFEYPPLAGTLCKARACETCAHRERTGQDRAPAIDCLCVTGTRPHCERAHRDYRVYINARRREQRTATSPA